MYAASKKAFLAFALCSSLALAGCNNVLSGLNTANNSLAELSKNSIPTACGIIAVAQGYFRQLEKNISAENIAIERKAEAAVKVICDNPPTDVAKAMGTLLQLWLTIQDSTKTT